MNAENLLAPAGLLYNTKTKHFHPIVFRPSPRPSDTESDTLIRFRSSFHHTDGFITKKEAQKHIASQSNWINTMLVWEWDGIESPHMTHDFCLQEFHIH